MFKALFLVAIASLFATACGSGNDNKALSKPEYIARSNAICQRTSKEAGVQFNRIVGSERPKRGEEQRYLSKAQRFLKQAAIPIIRENLTDRRALGAPEGDEKQIDAIIAAGEKAITGFEQIAADRSRVEGLFRGRIPDPAKRFDALSRRYGINHCGGDES